MHKEHGIFLLRMVLSQSRFGRCPLRLQGSLSEQNLMRRWAMTAIEWLTTQIELRDEIQDMDRAMQVSLQEAEQQKQTQRPPLEMPEEELLAHFKGSVLVAKVGYCDAHGSTPLSML